MKLCDNLYVMVNMNNSGSCTKKIGKFVYKCIVLRNIHVPELIYLSKSHYVYYHYYV